MFYPVHRENRHFYADQIEEMYRLRHRIYVDGRGWKALARPDKREVDQFDNEDATYLLGLDDIGHVTSGLRLVPTTKPHLIRDVFPHAVQWGNVPVADDIYEFTRFFVVPGRTKRREESGELLCAMFEYGLGLGLSHISLLCDTYFLPPILEYGWRVHPLGAPQPYDEGECIAVLFEVSEAALDGTRRARGLAEQSFLASPAYSRVRAVAA